MAVAPYRIFSRLLLLVLLVGSTAQVWTLWPFQVPDEHRHWTAAVAHVPFLENCNRLYGLVDLFAPESMHRRPGVKATPGTLAAAENPKPACYQPFMNYGGPSTYPGAEIAVAVGSALGLSALAIFYLARFFQAALILTLLAVLLVRVGRLKTSSFWRQLFTLYTGLFCLLPVALQQHSGVTADGVVSVFALVIAIVLVGDGPLTRWEQGVYAAGQLCAVLAKAPLMLWVFPVGAWLQERGRLTQDSKHRFLKLSGLVVALTVVLAFVSLSHTVPGQHSNPEAQKTFLREQPVEAFLVLARSTNYWLFRFPGFTGPLGHLDYGISPRAVNLQNALFGLLLLGFLLPALCPWRKWTFRWHGYSRRKFAVDLFGFVCFWGSGFLITFFLFLYWSAPGRAFVDGLQARYFLGHYIVFLAWLGMRLDDVVSIETPAPAVPYAWISWCTGAAFAVLSCTYVSERVFWNLARYQ